MRKIADELVSKAELADSQDSYTMSQDSDYEITEETVERVCAVIEKNPRVKRMRVTASSYTPYSAEKIFLTFRFHQSLEKLSLPLHRINNPSQKYMMRMGADFPEGIEWHNQERKELLQKFKIFVTGNSINRLRNIESIPADIVRDKIHPFLNMPKKYIDL